MNRDEFLTFIESVHDPNEVVTHLLRYGVCDEMDILKALAPYIVQLKEFMDVDEYDS